MGFGPTWNCLFANDIDHKKSCIYKVNWGDKVLKVADIKNVKTTDLPERADVAWASFPCQDLSLAGIGAGLKGSRSSTFWPFWDLIVALRKERRAPHAIVIENVCGTLTSHGGKDFAAILNALEEESYNYGAVVIDAALFLPQSRPRLFIVAVNRDITLPDSVFSNGPVSVWHNRTLINTYEKLDEKSKGSWIWWRMQEPSDHNILLSNIIEDEPSSVNWHTPFETQKILSMMSDINIAKVNAARKMKQRIVGTIYKRTRVDENGIKVQRAEVRFDEVAGCLRTPTGGSSRQLIMLVDDQNVKTRLISSRETARLMGLPDDYILSDNYNEAYHLTGDGLAVPVVRHLVTEIIDPLFELQLEQTKEAA